MESVRGRSGVGGGDGHGAGGLHADWFRRLSLIGAHVIVKTVQNSEHRGVLTAVDPETGSAIVLALAPEASGEEAERLQPTQLHMVLGHAIARVDALNNPAPAPLLDAYTAFGRTPTAASKLDGEALQAARDRVVHVLQRVRIAAVVEEDARTVCVMGGVARVVAPYCPSDCHSTNETVLMRLRGILEADERSA
jgi:Gemin6 protein